jgi:signal transduction histidine kinase
MTRPLPVQRWSIRTKTVALVAGYVVALCVVYGAFTISLVRREVARTQDRLEQTARLVGAELDAYVESGRQRLATVSRLPGLTYGLRTIEEASGEGRIPPWTSLHYLFFKSRVFTGGVFLLDRTGKVLWTEPPGQPWVGDTLAPQPTIAQVYARKQNLVSGGLDADRLFDRPHALIAFPVESPDGEIEGVLGGIVDLTAPEFTKILRAAATSEGRFIEVVDQNRRAIAGNDYPPADFAKAPTAAAADAWMLATVPLGQAPWQVIAGQPRAIALAEVWQSQRLLLALGLGLLVLALVVGTPIVNGFVRAIRRLTGAAEVMSRGDLSQPVNVGPRRDELATLARAFDQMRLELARSHAALERRLEEREELIRLQEVFLAGISHELRTPLNAIIGYGDMLADESLSPDGRQYLATLRAQSEHLLRMLSDLLTLSGLNTGTLAVEVCPVRVAAILARLKPLADELRHGKAVEVVWECPDALPTIETDPLRLEQILTNLLTNALKFTDQGRVVVRVLERTEQSRIAFEVSDTGIGIAAHELPHIFDEFRQVDGSLTRPYGGVGLGLTLVKKLTALLAGTVAVRSQPGAGSTFTVDLPQRFNAAGGASAAA